MPAPAAARPDGLGRGLQGDDACRARRARRRCPRRERGAQGLRLRRAHAHAGLRAPRQVGQRRLRDQAAAGDDHDVVDGLRDLGQQVARHEHGAAARRRRSAGSGAASGRPRGRGRWPARRGSAPRVAEQRAGQAEALAHPEREALHPPVAGVGEADLLEHLVDARRREPAAAASTRRWSRARRPGWKQVDSSTAPTWRNGSASSRVRAARRWWRVPAGRRDEAEQHAQRGGLAGAVGAEEAGDGALRARRS